MVKKKEFSMRKMNKPLYFYKKVLIKVEYLSILQLRVQIKFLNMLMGKFKSLQKDKKELKSTMKCITENMFILVM